MTMIDVRVPNDNRSVQGHSDAPTRFDSPVAARLFAVVRICIGWVFLWAFLDKTFGLGAATERSESWINGGSPTNGFLSFGTRGPLADFYQSFAGDWWADVLFMTGLAGIGIALTLGIGMRVAVTSGAVMLVMMWSAALWPENNPFMDDHLVYALVLVGLGLIDAGDTWGAGRQWKQLPLVRRYPVLR